MTDERARVGLRLGPGRMVPEFTVFVSSANDAVDLRARLDGLVHNAVNPVLNRRGSAERIHFYLDMWEKTEPRRLGDRETIDDEFVQRAVDSDLMVTLLVERLGPGTRNEIEAVLAEETEISALWFVAHGEDPDTPVAKFLHELEGDGVLRFDRAGHPESNESWEAMVRLLLSAVLTAMSPEEEDFRERRD